MNDARAVAGIEKSTARLGELGCSPEKNGEDLTCDEIVSRVYNHVSHVLVNAAIRKVYMPHGIEGAVTALTELLNRQIDENVRSKAESLKLKMETIDANSVAQDTDVEDIDTQFTQLLRVY